MSYCPHGFYLIYKKRNGENKHVAIHFNSKVFSAQCMSAVYVCMLAPTIIKQKFSNRQGRHRVLVFVKKKKLEIFSPPFHYSIRNQSLYLLYLFVAFRRFGLFWLYTFSKSIIIIFCKLIFVIFIVDLFKL